MVTKGYMSQHWQRYNTFAIDNITQYMHQVACIYIVLPQQKGNNTCFQTTYKVEGKNCGNFCLHDVKLAKTKKSWS